MCEYPTRSLGLAPQQVIFTMTLWQSIEMHGFQKWWVHLLLLYVYKRSACEYIVTSCMGLVSSETRRGWWIPRTEVQDCKPAGVCWQRNPYPLKNRKQTDELCWRASSGYSGHTQGLLFPAPQGAVGCLQLQPQERPPLASAALGPQEQCSHSTRMHNKIK